MEKERGGDFGLRATALKQLEGRRERGEKKCGERVVGRKERGGGGGRLLKDRGRGIVKKEKPSSK